MAEPQTSPASMPVSEGAESARIAGLAVRAWGWYRSEFPFLAEFHRAIIIIGVPLVGLTLLARAVHDWAWLALLILPVSWVLWAAHGAVLFGLRLPCWEESERLSWDVYGDGWQRVTEHNGRRFVITECTDPQGTGEPWELEDARPQGAIALDYFPTLTAAVREAELRAGLNDKRGMVSSV